MPRTGYLIAVAIAVTSAFAFAGSAGADHIAGSEPYFSCKASVARATLLNGNPIPTIEPLLANGNKEECAEDTAGAPTIALPPAPDPNPVVSATAVQASTEILCAGDDPDPAVTPANNDDCDAGRRSFEQQTLSKADAADVRINIGGLNIVAQVANTSARASCDQATNRPRLTSTSQVVGLSINGLPSVVPIPSGDEPFVLDIGLVRLVLNERIGTEGLYADNAASGEVTRRALHASVPADGSIADVVVAESTADFHGDVCPEGKIVVKKETAPDENPNSTVFNFTSTGLTPATFDLMDDGARTFDEVQPGVFTITEGPATNGYVLTAINCADNRTDNSTGTVATRSAAVDVGPGETVTCTFINAKPPPGVCPPGSTPNPQGQCVITNVTCPAGSTPNPQGQCVVNTTTCPPGSTRPDPNGPCVVVDRPGCPPGSSRNPQGQCVVQNVQCPTGTVFNPTTLGCSEGPRGGTVIPIDQRVRDFFRASPCVRGGFGRLVAIIGTNGPDRITGTNASDRIFALGGNDRVSGGRGDDCVEGGAGKDVLDGSNGNDFLLGGRGNDRVEGGPGKDRFSGGSGRDELSGGQGNDRMDGGAGNDRLNGGFGNDVIRGGSGNDGISNGNGRDRVFGGSGNDTINVAIVGPAASVDCGPGRDRVRITPGRRGGPLRDRTRNCEFLYIARRVSGRSR